MLSEKIQILSRKLSSTDDLKVGDVRDAVGELQKHSLKLSEAAHRMTSTKNSADGSHGGLDSVREKLLLVIWLLLFVHLIIAMVTVIADMRAKYGNPVTFSIWREQFREVMKEDKDTKADLMILEE